MPMETTFYQGEKENKYFIPALAVKISQYPLEKKIAGMVEEVNDPEVAKKLVRSIVDKNKHRIPDDFTSTAIVFDGITRFGTIYLWRNISSQNLMYAAGLETSFRVVNPVDYHPSMLKFSEACKACYDDAIDDGIPKQDARYVLPEGALTRVIISTTPRYYGKLGAALKGNPVPEIDEMGKTIESILKKEYDMEPTDEKLPTTWDIRGHLEYFNKGITTNTTYNSEYSMDYGADIDVNSLSLDMCSEASLAMLAQVVRQRSNLIEIAPVEDIAYNSTFIVPPTFTDKIKENYKEVMQYAHEIQMGLLEKEDTNLVYSLLLGQQARFKLKAKGYGIITTAQERTEGVAQWEIRNVIGIPITKELLAYDEFKHEIGPRCYRENICTEPPNFRKKFNTCPVQAAGGAKGKSIEEILELLDTENITTINVM